MSVGFATIGRRAAALALAAAIGWATPMAAETPDWLTCPVEDVVELGPKADREPGRIRELQPKAGAAPAPELHAQSRHAGLAYTLYAAFDRGEDPAAAFPKDQGLTPVAMIYGVPGRDGEIGPRPPRSRTFFGFVADEPATGLRFIVFRGTQEPAEWLRNVQVGQRPYPADVRRRKAKAFVHAGFLQIFESLELETAQGAKPFAAALPELAAGRETVFVGHSLGSALATFAGVETARRAPALAARLRLVTLASPRVGDPGFAAMAAAIGRIDRICNLVDPVTAVPPSTRTTRYVHVGTAHKVSSFDSAALNNDLENAGDQVLCWHGHTSYGALLDPALAERTPAQCFKP